jgi:DNA-binding transcriptional ArsR family regulator
MLNSVDSGALVIDALAQLGVEARQAVGVLGQETDVVIEPVGHLALRSDSVVIEADVEPVSGRADRRQPLSGRAGLEVATALLMAPAAGAAVRDLGRALGRSASTVSEVLAGLRRDGLVDERHRVEGTRLFWQVADR